MIWRYWRCVSCLRVESLPAEHPPPYCSNHPTTLPMFEVEVRPKVAKAAVEDEGANVGS